MARTKLSDSENILVKVDENNLIYIDPNSVVDGYGNVSERNINQENLVMYANLEADLVPRSIIISDNNQNTLTSIARGTLNFLRNQDGRDYDTSWTEAYNGTEIPINENEVSVKQQNFDKSGQSFGIQDINITIKGINAIPRVTINFIDVRGKTLFESPENSPYQAFFHLPWPIYYLTLKGFYGKAIKYRLHLVKFSSQFNSITGNFEITTEFLGSTFAYLSDIPLKGIMNAAYMYPITVTKDINSNDNAGTTTKKIYPSSRGYQVLKSVYAEYKQKKLIPQNFPVRTLRELLKAVEKLDVILEKEILDQVVSADLFVGLKDFEDKLKTLGEKIKAWSNKFLDSSFTTETKPDGTTVRWYNLSTEATATDKLSGTPVVSNNVDSLKTIIVGSSELLNNSVLFNNAIIKNETNGKFNKNEILSVSFKSNFEDGYYYSTSFSQYGFYQVSYDRLIDDYNTINKVFTEQKERLINSIEEKMNQIIRTGSGEIKGLGFEPTLRNVFAIILANADTYIRLLKEVHRKSFERSKERKKILEESGFTEETKLGDAIYPWPEIKKNSEKQKQKVISYPGEPDLVGKLKSDDATLWPEVEFVEDYLAVSTFKQDANAEKEGNTSISDLIFEDDVDLSKVSYTSTLTTLSSLLPYVDKSPSSFLYEIYERSLLLTHFESYDTNTLRELANIEFEAIKELTKEDIDLITILKDTVKSQSDLENLLLGFSPFDRYPYFEEKLVTVPYIKSLTENTFSITQYTPSSAPASNKFIDIRTFLEKYKSESYRKNIYPFNSDLYLNYIDQDEYGDDELLLADIYGINVSEGFISTPISPKDWVYKIGFYEDNLFKQKFTIGDTQTSILNTPYFHKQLYSDFLKNGARAKYTGSAYLLLNSLPFFDLEDVFLFRGKLNPVRMSSMFREISSSHYIPYYLILKWGSIYHRYKKHINEEVDIIDGFLNEAYVSQPIDGTLFFNNNEDSEPFLTYTINGVPVKYRYSLIPTPTPSVTMTMSVSPTPSISQTPSSTSSPTPSFGASPTQTPSISNTPTSTPTLSITPSVTPTISITPTLSQTPSTSLGASPTPTPSPVYLDDVGVHPFYDAIYHQILNGYIHYNVEQGNISYSGKSADGSIISKYDLKSNNIRYWTNFVDNSKYQSSDLRYTVLPSAGDNYYAGIKEQEEDRTGFRGHMMFPSNFETPESYDESVQTTFRCIWEDDLILDQFENKQFNNPLQYQRSFDDLDRTKDNIYSISTNYRKVIDLMATFTPSMLEEMENIFLDYTSEVVENDTSYKRFDKANYTKFQDLLRDILSVEKLETDSSNFPTTDSLIREIKRRQKEKLRVVTQKILSQENLVKFTIGNSKEIDVNIWSGFSEVDGPNKIYYNPYNGSQLTTENLNLLKLYLGEDIDGNYLDFFIDNDVELSEENIILFRSLVFIYAGYKKVNNSVTKEVFQNYIKTEFFNKVNDNGVNGAKARQTLFLHFLIGNFRTLQVQTTVNSIKFVKGFENDKLKLELYNYFKSFNDKWVAGNSLGQRLLLEEFLFLDKANTDIGDKVYLNLTRLLDLNAEGNENINLLSAIVVILNNTGIDMRPLPAYVNFYGTNYNNRPKLIPSTKVAQNLFGTFLDVDYEDSSPKIILQLTGPSSKHLADTGLKNKFNDDGFNISDRNNNPLIVSLPPVIDPAELYKSNRVVSFEVSFGDMNQSIFKSVKLNQDTLKNTTESFIVLENIGRTESGAGVYNVDVGLFDYYRQASYTCEVTMMGNVMIQPTMFFYLKNIPMFRGTYWITEVTHSVSNNSIITTFKGARIPYATLPDPKESFTSSYRNLFNKLLTNTLSKIQNQDANTTLTSLTIKDEYSEKLWITDIGSPAKFIEDLPKDIVKTAGLTTFGVPYNGYRGEKLIQYVKYKNDLWFRARVVMMNGPNYAIADTEEMTFIGQLNNSKKLLWSEIKSQNSTNYFYALRFSIERPTVDPEKILEGNTKFFNPSNNKTIQVEHGVSGIFNRTVKGPVHILPNTLSKYSIGMSEKSMRDLGLHDGDVVYFQNY